MLSSPRDAARLFDERVEAYDEFARNAVIGYEEILSTLGETAERLLRGNRKPSILDLGCGTGNSALAVLKHFPQARIVAYDCSLAMVAKAWDNLHQYNAEVAYKDATQITHHNEFDLAISSIVCHHLDDAQKADAYEKVHRALKKPGCFLLADVMMSNRKTLNKHLNEKWAQHMEKHGGKAFRDEIMGLDKRLHQPASLEDNHRFLRKAGFQAETIWRKHNYAVIAAFK